jgi:hypothetical protein
MSEETTIGMVTEMVNVAASGDEGARKIAIPFNFGSNLEEAVALFGEEAVFESYKADAVVGLQGFARRMLKLDGDKAMSNEDILAKCTEWKPGSRPKKSATDKALDMLNKLSEDDKLNVLKALGLVD